MQRIIRQIALNLALLALIVPGTAAADPLPGTSVYLVHPKLTDQRGETVPFDLDAGSPTIVSMFYASCEHVCPMLVATIQQVETGLAPAERARLRVLLVTFDDATDDPARLAEYAGQRHIDTTRWTLVRSTPADTRAVAAVLGIQYRRLPNGMYEHSTLMTLVDGEGVPLARSTRIGVPDPAFVEAVARSLGR